MKLDKGIILKGLQESLTEMHRLSGELSTTQLRVLVFVMRRTKASGTDIARALNLSKPTVSRCVATLSDENISRRSDEPLGFIRLESDPDDRRVKYAVLTSKGEALAARVMELFHP